ncbi:MAG: hypothetical protein CSA68_07325 [Rhodobacterales bacterium]|nr:MAG: hypothetical protein CSA68_07325 [Rhodobacterales bacterium]
MNTFFQNPPQRQTDARSIITDPRPEHTASLRLLAWAALKTERGQTVCQHRLQARSTNSDRQVA